MKAILSNGVELTPIMVTGGPAFVHGVNRDTLTFVFPDCSLDEKDKQFTEDNCERIIIVGNDGSEAIHTGYVIRHGLEKKTVEVAKESGDIPAVYESRVFVSMSQRTYAETKLATIETQNMDTAIAVAELGVMIAGGAE